jgi:hypothetical protein
MAGTKGKKMFRLWHPEFGWRGEAFKMTAAMAAEHNAGLPKWSKLLWKEFRA